MDDGEKRGHSHRARGLVSPSVVRAIQLLFLPVLGLVLVFLLSGIELADKDGEEALSKVVTVAYVLLGAALLHRIIAGIVLGMLVRAIRGRPVPRILKNLIGIAIALAAVMISVNLIFAGAFSGILAFSSVIGVVVGLALRPIILDVFSGLSTNLDSAFQIGDWIELGKGPDGRPYAGWVEEVNWRTTLIRTNSGNLIVCPNSMVSTAIITNFSRPWRLTRHQTELKLPPEVDPARAQRLLKAAVDATLDPEHGPSPEQAPEVLITALKDSAVHYTIRYWIDHIKHGSDSVRHRVVSSILQHLNIAGIPLAEDVVLNRDKREINRPGTSVSRAEVLARIELFRGIPHDQLETLAQHVEVRDVDSGDILVREGEEGDEMFVITQGGVEVLVRVKGEEVAVARMYAGDYFGEMSLLTGEPRTATVRMTTIGRVYSIGRSAIEPLMTSDPTVMNTLSQNLAERNLNRKKKVENAREDPEEEKRSLAAGLLEKMRRVFGVAP